MLFRILSHVFAAKGYFHHYFGVISNSILDFQKDYAKFLMYIFTIFLFKPLTKIITFVLFCLKVIFFIFNILLIANNIFLRIVFIIIPINISFFLYSFLSFKLKYLCMEFIFMFVDAYILSFKYSIKCFIYET